jgi:hypothetical protein
VEAFRPICLQNCSVKILTKILTSRLQLQIGNLVDLDQTGFIRGRSITENFVYAMELVQCCHKRRVPTLAIKLDFAKAFDTVNWDALDNTTGKRFQHCMEKVDAAHIAVLPLRSPCERLPRAVDGLSERITTRRPHVAISLHLGGRSPAGTNQKNRPHKAPSAGGFKLSGVAIRGRYTADNKR